MKYKKADLLTIYGNWFKSYCPYEFVPFDKFNYDVLQMVQVKKRQGKASTGAYNDVIIMLDTETSKKAPNEYKIEKGKRIAIPVENHVVMFTISIRAYHTNIATLWGTRPSECVECIERIINAMPGEVTYMFTHNLSYDWTFLNRFLIARFGAPVKQLNTKPHYPINIQFENGLILKDTAILAQRKLEKWANDLDVEHKKAVGQWDYNKIRNQNETYTDLELQYAEHDTLAGVECIDKTLEALNKTLGAIPYTATGIPREQVQKRGKKNSAHEKFLKQAVEDYKEQEILELLYHGGFTHANRFTIGDIYKSVKGYDFGSSYPFSLLAFKYPMEKFTFMDDMKPEEVLKNSDRYAYYFLFCATNVDLKNPGFPMPCLQLSKRVRIVNEVVDNGRVISCDFIAIWLTDADLEVIASVYKWDKATCSNVRCAYKDYLPRWFTDYVFEKWQDKCNLKGGDPVLYSISKSIVNSIYGMCAQKPVKDDIIENYDTGEYLPAHSDPEEKYKEYLKNIKSVLPYQWAIWCTSYAFRNLFKLGSCCKLWLYSDTDSAYGIGWDIGKVEAYNNWCKDLLHQNNYGKWTDGKKELWLGVAENDPDDDYIEFVALGAKRYAGRKRKDKQIHITVAGVPKKASEQLNNDLNNFKAGFIFSGVQSGKLQHTYIQVDDIYIDENGNETGNSIDLSPADYTLDETEKFEYLFTDEIEIQVYTDE